ncbi:MAG: hypothetical protein ACT4PI_16700 [Actinomycetota bacterium]
MSRGEWKAFLLEGTRTAKLATTRKDGRPHVSPIWFLLRLPWSRSLRSPLPHAAGNPGAGGPGPLSVDGSSSFRRGEWRPIGVDAERHVRIAPDGVAVDARLVGGEHDVVAVDVLVRVTPGKVLARAGIAD